MPIPPRGLIWTVCPCSCGHPLVFPERATTEVVHCPYTGARLRHPRWQPFGRRQWDDFRVLAVLRQVLALLKASPSDRKRRLLAVAVGRGCLNWCRNATFLDAIAAGEELADSCLTSRDLAAIETASLSGDEWRPESALDHWRQVALRCIGRTTLDFGALEGTYGAGVWVAFKDIIPNPFHAPAVSEALRTSAVVGLAETAYSDRAFDRLPILADALEEAGCNERGLLDHLRGPGPHYRGCWALDAVLGKG